MVWSWNETNSDTWSNGIFETKEETIQDALDCLKWRQGSLLTNNPVIYIGRCEFVPFRTDVDVDRIMEELNECYYDDSGCDTYIYEDVTEEQRKWLEDKLSDLMEEFNNMIGLKPRWFNVIAIEKIDLNQYKQENNIEILNS